jgi:hypothetical protein
MTREELREELQRRRIRTDAYSLDGGLPNDAIILDVEDGKWVVFYHERGKRDVLGRFKSEQEACECLLETLSSDPVYTP